MHYIMGRPSVLIDSRLVAHACLSVLEGQDGVAIAAGLLEVFIYLVTLFPAPVSEILREIIVGVD